MEVGLSLATGFVWESAKMSTVTLAAGSTSGQTQTILRPNIEFWQEHGDTSKMEQAAGSWNARFLHAAGRSPSSPQQGPSCFRTGPHVPRTKKHGAAKEGRPYFPSGKRPLSSLFSLLSPVSGSRISLFSIASDDTVVMS